MPMYSLHSIKTLETRWIKRFPAKTFTNVGMVQQVLKNRVRAPTLHTGNKSPDTRRGPLASLAIHNPCRSRFIALKRLCIHCTKVNILRLQDTLTLWHWQWAVWLRCEMLYNCNSLYFCYMGDHCTFWWLEALAVSLYDISNNIL